MLIPLGIVRHCSTRERDRLRTLWNGVTVFKSMPRPKGQLAWIKFGSTLRMHACPDLY